MTNKVLIGVLVVIFLALGGAGASWVKNNVITPIAPSSTTPNSTVQDSTVPSVSSVPLAPSASSAPPAPPAPFDQNQQTSLNELWSSGASQKCTFVDGNATGTAYISDGKMKGNFSSTNNGQTTTSHMIVQGGISYVWMDNQTQGFKIPIEDIPQQIGASSSGAIDLNRQFDVKCQSENVEDNTFNLPEGINFQEITGLNSGSSTQATGGATIDLKAAPCGVCDKLPDSAKSQCKKALSC